MRSVSVKQPGLTEAPIAHQHARELAAMSALIDQAHELAERVHADLVEGVKNPMMGRPGMTGDFVFRAVILKQLNGFSHAELAFHLLDSSTYGTFCRLASRIRSRPRRHCSGTSRRSGRRRWSRSTGG